MTSNIDGHDSVQIQTEGQLTQLVTEAHDSAASAGEHATDARRDAETAGQQAASAGDHAENSREHATAAGQRATTAGDYAATAGQHATAAGQHAADARQSAQDARDSASAAGLGAEPSWIYAFVVGILGVALLILVTGMVVASLTGARSISTDVVSATTLILGGLIGVLAPTPSTRKNKNRTGAVG